MTFLFNIIVIGLLAGFFSMSGARAQDAATDERSFRYFENHDLLGPYYIKSSRGQISMKECEKACRLDRKCKAFSYRSDENICYLRDAAARFEMRVLTKTGVLNSIEMPKAPFCSAQTYETAENLDSKAGYLSFLKNCRKGPYAVKAKKALKDLVERSAWIRARETDTCQSYRRFLENYPSRSGVFYKEASLNRYQKCQALVEREERAAWDLAVNENSCESYQNYLGKYPSGLHSPQARIRKEQKCPLSCDAQPKCVVEAYYTALGSNSRRALGFRFQPDRKQINAIRRIAGSRIYSSSLVYASESFATVNARVSVTAGRNWQNWNVQVKLMNVQGKWKITKICGGKCRD